MKQDSLRGKKHVCQKGCDILSIMPRERKSALSNMDKNVWMMKEHTLMLIIRLLEECLEQEYSVEEIRSKIRDILKLMGVYFTTEPRR